MATLLPSPAKGLRERLRGIAKAVGETRAHVIASREALEARLARLQLSLDGLASENRDLGARLELMDEQLRNDRVRVLEALKLIYSDEPRQRERLWALRETASYEEAYSDPEPLVSVVIATHSNHRLLAARAIPSVLAQTYQNLEIIVVGDNAPQDTATSLRQFDDPRITYYNLAIRGPYPTDPDQLWLVAGTLPWIEAVQRSRGRWIAPLDDDDAFTPHHVEALLQLARRDRLELSYGKFQAHLTNGDASVIGSFPPRLGQFALQGAIYHAQLRFFAPELADAIFSLPGDWAMAERMLRTGVRFGMLDDVVVDYYPSRHRYEAAEA